MSSLPRPPKYRKMSATRRASPRACVRRAFPVSVAIRRAISSTRPSSESAIRRSARPRSRGATFRQPSNAAAAIPTARSTSRAVPRGTSAIGSRRAGFSTVMTPPSMLSIHSPPTSIRWWRTPDARSVVVAAMAMALPLRSCRCPGAERCFGRITSRRHRERLARADFERHPSRPVVAAVRDDRRRPADAATIRGARRDDNRSPHRGVWVVACPPGNMTFGASGRPRAPTIYRPALVVSRPGGSVEPRATRRGRLEREST